jgi:hypothetical protein
MWEEVKVPDPLRYCQYHYWHIASRGASLGDMLRDNPSSTRGWTVERLKAQLREAIEKKHISLEDYSVLIGDEFEDKEEVVEDMKELWNAAYGKE